MEHSEDKEKNTKFKKGDEANSKSLNIHTHIRRYDNAKQIKNKYHSWSMFFCLRKKLNNCQIQNLTFERVQTVAWLQYGKSRPNVIVP